MDIELVRVTTADGLRLDGALSLPTEAARPEFSFDAVLCIHGAGGNFYGSTLLEAVALRMLELGLAALSVNTRGHDIVSMASTSSGGRRQGGALEVVDDCRLDLIAWIDFLAQRQMPRVLLLGHSLGAVKAIYTMGAERLPSVVGVVAISPPYLSYNNFAASPKRETFLANIEAANTLVAAGQPDALMSVDFPLPYIISAASYLDKYGPAQRYNVVKHLERVAVPVLLTLGSLEVRNNVAFAPLPAALEPLIASNQAFSLAVVAAADHFYSGARSELIGHVERWLRRAYPAAGSG